MQYSQCMKAPFSHTSSAAFWLAYGTPGFPKAVPVDDARFSGVDAETLRQFASYLRFLPVNHSIDCLVPSQADRRAPWFLSSHSCPSAFRGNSFLRAIRGPAVCRPELTYIQMASLLSLPQVIHVGMMLCGIYAKGPYSDDSSQGAERKLFRRKQLVSTADLSAFLQEAHHMRGIGNAKAALPFVVEGSASPMESIALLMLCLPRDMGGWGLPVPCMNAAVYVDGSGEIRPRKPDVSLEREKTALFARVPFGNHRSGGHYGGRTYYEEVSSGEGRRECGNLSFSSDQSALRFSPNIARRDDAGREFFECDLVWPEKRLVVEFHGRSSHGEWDDVAHDLRRGNILAACGIDYRVITSEILDDEELLEEFAAGIAERLEIALLPGTREFGMRQAALRNELEFDPLEKLIQSHAGLSGLRQPRT